MNNKNLINEYLINLGKALNLELKLEENGIAAIQIDEGFPLIIEVPQKSDKFFLYAPVKQVLGDENEILDIFNKALMINLFQIKTGGGALALSDKLQEIVFCLSAPIATCDKAQFAKIVTDFIINARKIKSELEETEDSFIIE